MFTMKPHLMLLALIGCCACLSAPAADVTSRSIAGLPLIEKNVSNAVAPTDAKGMAWRWSPEGRRDVGQTFEVIEPFTARELAIEIRSSMKDARPEAPFSLVFTRCDPTGSITGAPIATFTGVLPGAAEKLRSGCWLDLTFPPLPLEPGRYAFVLSFTDGPLPGQGAVFVVDGARQAEQTGLRGIGGQSTHYKVSAPLSFILSSGASVLDTHEPRELLVDQRGGAPYRTLRAAVADAKPGDTIRLAQGSGPYREILYIPQSGTPEACITVDGSGETVTGFEPLEGFVRDGQVWTCDLTPYLSRIKHVQGFTLKDGRWQSEVFPAAFPSVLTYRGERLRQDAISGDFTRYAHLSDDGQALVLEDGVSPEGWEIALRPFAVRVLNASHHCYRNLRASGSLNDGFNLHGNGEDLRFEHIEGFQNIDEGFSAHDDIRCSIVGGKFWDNDNGLYGGQAEIVLKDVDIYDNLGFGFGITKGEGNLAKVRIWGNGICQFIQSPGTRLSCEDVEVYALGNPGRQWISVQESRRWAEPVQTRIDVTGPGAAELNLLPSTTPAKL